MRRCLPLGLGLVFFALVSAGPSAQITTEQFNAGAGGWQGSMFGNGAWTFTGGSARITFTNEVIPWPYVGTLSNLPTASGGSFTGNFDAAGIEIIGFRFFSASTNPSSVRLELGGPTSSYQKTFFPNVTGVWQTLVVSLQSVALGGWSNLQGNVGAFVSVRQNVKYVAIKVDRAAVVDLTHHGIDDIFLDRLPVVRSLTPFTGAIFALQGDYLRTNETYRIEATTNLTSEWSSVASMVATSRLQHFSIPVDGSASQTFFRFRGP